MKKIALILSLLMSMSAFAECNEYYSRAAIKRSNTIRTLSFAGAFLSPILVLTGGGAVITVTVVASIVGGAGVAKEHRAKNTSFGKVLAAIKGDVKHLSKRVAKNLKKEGIIVDKDDPDFQIKLAEISADLNKTEVACPYLGFDKKYKDIYKIYNLKEFSKIVTEEYKALL